AVAERTWAAADQHSAGGGASKPVLVVISADVALPEPIQFEKAEALPAAVVAGRRQRRHVVSLLDFVGCVTASWPAANPGRRAEPLQWIVVVQPGDAHNIGCDPCRQRRLGVVPVKVSVLVAIVPVRNGHAESALHCRDGSSGLHDGPIRAY